MPKSLACLRQVSRNPEHGAVLKKRYPFATKRIITMNKQAIQSSFSSAATQYALPYQSFEPKKVTPEQPFSWPDSVSLTNAISAQAFDKQGDLLALNAQFPAAQGVVGDLPADWLLRQKHDSKDTNRKKIFFSWKDAVQNIRKICHGQVVPVHGIRYVLRGHTETPTVLDDRLSDVLNETGVTADQGPIQFTFVDEGSYGTVHRFKINEKSYALKVFKQIINTLRNSGDLHGSPIEQNRASYLQKALPHNPFARFYFGDINHGYMVTEFVDDASEKSTEKPNTHGLASLGLVHGDLEKADNVKNRKIVDYGGIQNLKTRMETLG